MTNLNANFPIREWRLYVEIEFEEQRLYFSPTHHWHDSIRDLTRALVNMMRGHSNLHVVWYLLPTIYTFHFEGDSPLKFRLTSGSDVWGIIETSRLDLCKVFWRALTRLESQITPAEYLQITGYSFPAEELEQLSNLIRNYRP
ncbi:MAG: hypothetical protein MUF87_10110 [Anaerolineae bacterium]|jgi:hypothetical protein|nr:hypothetical protein [Anaerolineae bacterium]